VDGARPGPQNRECDAENTKSSKQLRQSHRTLTAQGQRAAPDDPDLAAVIDAWPKLSGAVRASMVKLAKSALRKGVGASE
jgi:hypothetical protein